MSEISAGAECEADALALEVLFVTETVVEWRRFNAGQQPVYDDEEDEAD